MQQVHVYLQAGQAGSQPVGASAGPVTWGGPIPLTHLQCSSLSAGAVPVVSVAPEARRNHDETGCPDLMRLTGRLTD